ncbi:MAG: hypothetical protein WD794_17340 [Mycobacteriales bacterium]
MIGLDDDELAEQDGQPLPAREQMSLMSTGGLGLVDASTADGYTGPADSYAADAREDMTATTPTENDGEYSPSQSATASDS